MADVEDQSTKELNNFVQNLMKQMQDRFEEMSQNIIGRIDDMGKTIMISSKEKESMTSKNQSMT